METLKFKVKEIERFEMKKTNRYTEFIISSSGRIEMFEASRRTGFYFENLAKSKIGFRELFSGNRPRIPNGWFVIGDRLIDPLCLTLEAYDYRVPLKGRHGERIRVDKQVGEDFDRYLTNNEIDVTDKVEQLTFVDEKGIEFIVQQYHEDLLDDFNHFFRKIWLLENALPYFKEIDPKALPSLNEIILKNS